jgi:methionyl-tRNA synthetase
MGLEQVFAENPLILFLILAWTLPWKGVALWKAALRNDMWWFIALLVINTLGVLEILYIFIFSKQKTAPVPPQGPEMKA